MCIRNRVHRKDKNKLSGLLYSRWWRFGQLFSARKEVSRRYPQPTALSSHLGPRRLHGHCLGSTSSAIRTPFRLPLDNSRTSMEWSTPRYLYAIENRQYSRPRLEYSTRKIFLFKWVVECILGAHQWQGDWRQAVPFPSNHRLCRKHLTVKFWVA